MRALNVQFVGHRLGESALCRKPFLGALLLAAATMTACMPSEPRPASIATLGVESVYFAHAGLYIEADRDYLQETGVFVPCDKDKFSPQEGGDPAYKKVADGVFTYFIAG